MSSRAARRLPSTRLLVPTSLPIRYGFKKHFVPERLDLGESRLASRWIPVWIKGALGGCDFGVTRMPGRGSINPESG